MIERPQREMRIVLGLLMKTLDLGVSWGTRPKFVMEMGFRLAYDGFSFGLAHDGIGFGLKLEPRPICIDGWPHAPYASHSHGPSPY